MEGFIMSDGEIKERITKSLKTVLADTYVIYAKTQNFHWNIVDQNFFSLHKMFEEQYEELAEAIDLIAERIRFFGVKAPGSLKEFLQLATIEESKTDLSGNEMIKQLLLDHQAMSTILHAKTSEAQEVGDEATADIYIERLRAHNKIAWMLESHIK